MRLLVVLPVQTAASAIQRTEPSGSGDPISWTAPQQFQYITNMLKITIVNLTSTESASVAAYL